jgi:succinate dehydrogenase/fumarate reductase flavoprotein subunit
MAISGTDWGSPARIKELVLDNPALTIKAASLGELAIKTGLPPEVLIATISRYNESIKQGVDRDFGRFGPGSTLMPAAIDSPPYHAIQFFPLTRKSMGGVAIDEQCRVLDAAGVVIPGLYAVGELTGAAGINGETGMGGMFLGPCIVTGRVAGRSALGELPPRPRTSPAASLPAGIEVRSFAKDTQTCLQCHALPNQIALKREGYWHFEQVHRVVLERGMDCATCHSEVSARHSSAFHRHDLRQLSLRCMMCHQADE